MMIATELTVWNQAVGKIQAQVAVDDLVGQEGERAASLFEEHPEQDVEDEDQQHGDDAVARHLAIADAFDHQHHGQADEQHGQDDLQLSAPTVSRKYIRDHAQATQGDPDDAHRAAGTGFRRADALQGAAADVEPPG
jgi:hypothetical protein